MQEKTIYEIINEMPRDMFHKKIVRDLCQTKEFSHLVASWGKNTPKIYKKRIREYLTNLDIPAELLQSDSDLDAAATAIFNRAVAIR